MYLYQTMEVHKTYHQNKKQEENTYQYQKIPRTTT